MPTEYARPKQAAPAAFALRGSIVYSEAPTRLAVKEDGYLVCENGLVAGVFDTLPERYGGIPVSDTNGALILPGLVDLHLHAPQYTFRALGMDMELLDWLNARTFPEEAKYRDEEFAQEAYGIFVDALRRSPTTRAAMFGTIHVPATLRLMRLLEQSGLVTLVGKVNMDRNSPENLCEESAAASLAATREWLAACEAEGFSNTRPILTPRFIPSCSDEVSAGLAALQAETGLPVQSHLSENPSEGAWVRELCPDADGYGRAYANRGLFGGEGCPTIMAHCVWCDDAETELLRQNNVFVAHCTQSNNSLASGIAPARRFLQAGVKMGLGSDIAGGYTLSLFRAMEDAIAASKLRWRLVSEADKPLTVPEAFYLATRGGGEFFGRVGAFEPGYAFDALVVDDATLPTPLQLTAAERLERLVYLYPEAVLREKYVDGVRLF